MKIYMKEKFTNTILIFINCILIVNNPKYFYWYLIKNDKKRAW